MRVAIGLLAVAIVACGTQADSRDGTSTTTATDLPEGLSAAVFQTMKQDVSVRSGAPIDGVELSSIDEIEFPDASLGCPEKGVLYAQVVTPGFEIVFVAASTEFNYRVARGDTEFRLCADPE
jgi:hypothetical protein